MAERVGVPSKCEICMGILQDPKLLPCFHICCRDCVKRLFVRGIKEVTCPVEMCRKSFPCIDPESLPDALCIYHMRDVQRLRSRTTSGDAICSLCMDAGKGQCQAQHFCDHCTYICTECSEKHTSDPTYSEHKAVSFVKLTDQNDDILSEKLKRTRTMSASGRSRNSCKIHPGNEKKYYCLDCHDAVCSVCIEVSHAQHKYKATNTAARECCESIQETLQSVTSLAKEAEEAVALVDKAVDAVKNQKEDLAYSIDGSFKQMYKILENKQKELHRQLEGMAGSKSKTMNQQKHDFERTAGEMKRRNTFTKELLQTSTDYEIFTKFQFLEEVERPQEMDKFKSFKVPKLGLTKYNKKEFMDMCREIDVYSEQASVANCKLIDGEELTGETMKYSTFDVLVCDHDNKPCSSVQNVRVHIKCSKNGADSNSHTSYKRNGLYSVLFCPEFRGRHEVSVTINNTPMVGSPFTLNVQAAIDRLGYPDIPSIQNVRLGPRGIAITPAGEIITCQWNGKKIFKYSSLGEFQSGESTGYTRLTGVALAPSGHIFVVTAEGTGAVLKCNQDGTIENAVYYDSNDRKCFKNPRGIAICQKGNIHVCDRDNNQVQIYSTDLNFIGAFKLSFLKDDGLVGKVPRPNDIAFDCLNRMVITDIENCFVHVFDRGSYNFSFSRVQEENMGSPEGIAIGRDGLIYVSEYNKHRISVFQGDGKWLRSLGKKGSGDGELNFPTGVAVDAYGTVYVCDIMNNRIQIF